MLYICTKIWENILKGSVFLSRHDFHTEIYKREQLHKVCSWNCPLQVNWWCFIFVPRNISKGFLISFFFFSTLGDEKQISEKNQKVFLFLSSFFPTLSDSWRNVHSVAINEFPKRKTNKWKKSKSFLISFFFFFYARRLVTERTLSGYKWVPKTKNK